MKSLRVPPIELESVPPSSLISRRLVATVVHLGEHLVHLLHLEYMRLCLGIKCSGVALSLEGVKLEDPDVSSSIGSSATRLSKLCTVCDGGDNDDVASSDYVADDDKHDNDDVVLLEYFAAKVVLDIFHLSLCKTKSQPCARLWSVAYFGKEHISTSSGIQAHLQETFKQIFVNGATYLDN
ncbi:hypothetical protein DOY81_006756 [Sarcophaga bullata]|nr:hypothetical protein DOY81_006756 [Sarcophaga bullata]